MMSNPGSSLPKQELLGGFKANNQLTFSELYDQYAAVLLGVITKIVSDKTEAIALLEVAFSSISLQMDTFQAGKQPLFLGLLQIARSTALEALKQRRQGKITNFQLTETGNVLSPAWQKTAPTSPVKPVNEATTPIDPRLKELLDSILFKNCTPEEAATSLGMPIETVRQQLRVAMQQLRTTSRT